MSNNNQVPYQFTLLFFCFSRWWWCSAVLGLALHILLKNVHPGYTRQSFGDGHYHGRCRFIIYRTGKSACVWFR